METIGFHSLIYYSLADYVKLYFIDFKVCNSDYYNEIFNSTSEIKDESAIFISNKEKNNLFEDLEKNSLFFITLCSEIFSLNYYPLYYKGLAVMYYCIQTLISHYQYSESQTKFIEEWFNFLINQAEQVFNIDKKIVFDICEIFTEFFQKKKVI